MVDIRSGSVYEFKPPRPLEKTDLQEGWVEAPLTAKDGDPEHIPLEGR